MRMRLVWVGALLLAGGFGARAETLKPAKAVQQNGFATMSGVWSNGKDPLALWSYIRCFRARMQCEVATSKVLILYEYMGNEHTELSVWVGINDYTITRWNKDELVAATENECHYRTLLQVDWKSGNVYLLSSSDRDCDTIPSNKSQLYEKHGVAIP